MKQFVVACCLLWPASMLAQLAPLRVEKIMADPKWMGSQPGSPAWSPDSKTLYFDWNPDGKAADSVYQWQLATKSISLAPQWQAASRQGSYVYNNSRTQLLYSAGGELYLHDLRSQATQQLTYTLEAESAPQFLAGDQEISFVRSQQVYNLHLRTGVLRQLSNFVRGTNPNKKTNPTGQEGWLQTDQLAMFEVVRQRKEDREASEGYRRAQREAVEPLAIYTEDKNVSALQLSANGRYISYRLSANAGGKATIVPSYVTESGFTTDLNTRTKVGSPLPATEWWIYDRQAGTTRKLQLDSLPGLYDLPDYLNDYPQRKEERLKKKAARALSIGTAWWSPTGDRVLLNVYAQDNKDRWLLLVDPATGRWQLADRQRDEAWIAGPGIGGSFGGASGGWLDSLTAWYQSEASGYSHLYTLQVRSLARRQLTSGNYEVQTALLSADRQFFYLTTNEVHPGVKHFYKLPVAGGKATQLTSLTGANEVVLSPDEQWLAIRHSYSNKPWELYLQRNAPGARAEQLTDKAQSALFKSYAWRDPQIVTITAADGAQIYGRLYKPEKPHPSKPAVIFVHGAGYLQNAHKWWSSYFREYMFHNLLTDLGYTVLDIDYRASAGYGRNWRTGIYRHMGGKDLSDHVDAARWLVQQHGIDAGRIGIYGGSYGGFITLMGLFTSPGTFAAGAALRPVTDWAHYNHGYTANILNTPVEDSLSYRRSSPIYHAAGLKDELLICHGMIDVNVHFQDVVRLQQKLIELGKDNWELAAYPLEDHGFVEPSSWTDEYKRILKLFERVLKR